MKMFTKLRLRLTLQYTLLATCVYLLLGAIASAFFYSGLTETIDSVLGEVANSLDDAVQYNGSTVSFVHKPLEHVHLSDKHAIPTIQLWNASRVLVEEYGPHGTNIFMAGESEGQAEPQVRLRSVNKPVHRGEQIVGFLQIQLPVSGRDDAIREFMEALTATAPFLIGGLAATGYFFASRAVKPVEESFALLKQFSADAGHELKTPVAIIRSACDNLADDLKDYPAAAERLEVIHRTTERMERLVLDLLLLTKTEQAKDEGRKESTVPVVELDMVFREILGEFGDLFEEKEIELYADRIDSAHVQADKDSLYKIFSNLLRNAARYTDKGGKVTASLEVSVDYATIIVSDTGIGIPPESLAKIFDRFYRVDQSRARTGGGSGLGLAIVKALVEKLDGSIDVTSEAGKGSTFIVKLPLYNVAGRPT